jgi:hypothetical protein
MLPKNTVILCKAVKKKPNENKKNGIASYKMNIKRSLIPSIHISDFLSQVGKPTLPIVRSREDLER